MNGLSLRCAYVLYTWVHTPLLFRHAVDLLSAFDFIWTFAVQRVVWVSVPCKTENDKTGNVKATSLHKYTNAVTV